MVDVPVYENDAAIIVTATADDQTDFDFDFLVYDGEQVKVIFEDVSEGTSTELTYLTEYTVTGVGQANGGTVTLIGQTVVIGDKVTIYREVPIKRENDYQQSGDFKAETINRELDLFTMMLQEMRRENSRSILMPVGLVGGLITGSIAEGKTIVRGAGDTWVEGFDAGDIGNAQANAEAAAASAVLAQNAAAALTGLFDVQTTTGTSTDYQVAPTVPIASYANGQVVYPRIHTLMTADATLGASGLAQKPWYRDDGVTRLGSGMGPAGFIAPSIYLDALDGGNGGFMCVVPMPLHISVHQAGVSLLEGPSSPFKRQAQIDASITAQVGPIVDTAVDAAILADNAKFVLFSELVASGVSGGSSSTSWQIRPFTIQHDGVGASDAGNFLILPDGTYRVVASAPGYNCRAHQIRLRISDGGTTYIYGTTENADGSSGANQTRSMIDTIVTLSSGSGSFAVEHQAQDAVANGFGLAASFGGAERYMTGVATKIA